MYPKLRITGFDFTRKDKEPKQAVKPAKRLPKPLKHWSKWLPKMLPNYFGIPFADRHKELYEWVERLTPDVKPRPFVFIVGRGGGKSTSTEGAIVRIGANKSRKYIWYISETQNQADEHVANIASMLESSTLEKYYPKLTSRKIDKYGHSKGWRRNRIRTSSGLTIDSLGLDTARRGFKVEDQRPDMMIFDDIDSDLDSIVMSDKKESIITKKLLPAGSTDCAIVFVQNLVIATGIFGRLYDGSAKWLQNRLVSGIHPAIIDLKTENVDGRDVIISGTHTWDGQDLTTCQLQIDEWGLQAFLEECQHEVYNIDGQVFNFEWFNIKEERNRYSIHDEGLINQTVKRYQFWDTALKAKKTNDPSMCLTIDLTKNYTALVRGIWHDRIESAYLAETIEEQANMWNYDNKLEEVIIEDKGSGTTAIQTIRKASPGWLAEKIREFTPTGSKDYRAKTASMWMPRNCFYLPYPDESIEWYNELFDNQHGLFFRFRGEGSIPHDEIIDCVSMSVLYLEHYISQGYYARLKGVIPYQHNKNTGMHDRVRKALEE